MIKKQKNKKKIQKNAKKKISVKEDTNPVATTTQNIKTTFIYEKPNLKTKESNSNLDENDSSTNIKTRSKKVIEYTESNDIVSPPVKDKKKSRKKVIKKKIDKKFISTDINNDENSDEEQPVIKTKKEIRVTSQQKKPPKRKLSSDEEENEEPKPQLKKQTTQKKN